MTITSIESLDDILSSHDLSVNHETLLSNEISGVLKSKCPGPYDSLPDLFRIIYEYAAYGKRISDLPNQNNLIDSTKFLISRDDKSYSATYGQLLSSSFADILAGISVGSMAFEESWKYSPANHEHGNDYNYTSVFANEFPEPKQKIASISVGLPGRESLNDCTKYDIYVPEIEFDDPPTPEIGTLRFVYLKNGSQLKTNSELLSSDAYDGWVWPDGSSITGLNKKRFKKAIQVYGNGSSNIRVPNLSGMFRPACIPVSNVEKTIAQHVQCPAHRHDIGQLTVNGNAKTAGESWPNYTSPTIFNNNTTKDQIHDGIKGGKTSTVEFEHDVKNGPYFENLKVDDFVPAGKYMPQRLYMPVQVYIGGESGSYRNEYQLTFQLNVNGKIIDLGVYYIGEDYVKDEHGITIETLQYPTVAEYHGFDLVWSNEDYDGKSKDEIIAAITNDTVVTCHYEPNDEYEWDILVDYDYAEDETGTRIEINDLTAINVDDPTTPRYIETLGLSTMTSDTDEISGMLTI